MWAPRTGANERQSAVQFDFFGCITKDNLTLGPEWYWSIQTCIHQFAIHAMVGFNMRTAMTVPNHIIPFRAKIGSRR